MFRGFRFLSSSKRFMSGKPIENASSPISLKRKRGPVWPFSTRIVLEQALAIMVERGTVQEFSPPDEWRIHPSTEARGSGFQHERRVWGTNDSGQWITLKIRQHSQDPERTAARTGFEGGFVSNLNSGLSQLLRSIVRGGGRPIASNSPATFSGGKEAEETSDVRPQPPPTGTGTGKCSSSSIGYCGKAAQGSPTGSADSEEEKAAEAEASLQLDRLRTPLPSPVVPTRFASLALDPTDTGNFRSSVRERRTVLSAWSDYVGTPIRSINTGPSIKPRGDSAVQWFSFSAPSRISPPRAPDYSNFNMSDAQYSWDDGDGYNMYWYDDPTRPSSQPPAGSSDPSHVSASVESSVNASPSSVSPSNPQTDSERTPENGSVESGRAERGADGIWRHPNGDFHPRNIYNDLHSDYEDLPDYTDSGSSAISPSA